METVHTELDFMESFYGPHGFPADGPQPSCQAYDYYSHSFAITFYSLIYAKLQEGQDPERAAKYRQRAIDNLPFVAHLYGTDGAAIAYGRSMIYRFACCAFFAALAFDGQEVSHYTYLTCRYVLIYSYPHPSHGASSKALSCATFAGLLNGNPSFIGMAPSVSAGRTLKRSSARYALSSSCNRCSLVTVLIQQDYNSAQSPYWALKLFLVLALPDTHPFWAATEEPYPEFLLQKAFYPAPQWGQVFSHSAGHDFMLSSGASTNWPKRGGAVGLSTRRCIWQ